jgi:chitin disaccharide deacetylase
LNFIDNPAENLPAGQRSISVDVNVPPTCVSRKAGLIVNADDWGRSRETTDRIRDCVACGSVTATSAMVFMEDSERASEVARECGVDVGLHLNLTTEFSMPGCSARLLEHQHKVARSLRGNRFAPIVFHRQLADSFEYLVRVQLEEFSRLYETPPQRIDGHHHMHLCANVLYAKLLPEGTQVRRNFSIRPGEKSITNRLYRKFVDSRLARRHQLADYFFSLAPLDPPARLSRIFTIARESVVELETHPVNPNEYHFLTQGEMLRQADDILVAGGFAVLRQAMTQPSRRSESAMRTAGPC